MVQITKAAIEKIHEEMNNFTKEKETLFLRLGMGLG